MTQTTRHNPNPNGHRDKPKKRVRPGETITIGRRTLTVAQRKKPKPPKKFAHIPGSALDLDLRINTGKFAPAGFSIDVISSSWGGASVFTPSVDPHYGIFIDDEEELLLEIMENLAVSRKARRGATTWQAPVRVIDCTPTGEFKKRKFPTSVVSNTYYTDAANQELRALKHLATAIHTIAEKSIASGATAPPNRHYDLMLLWLTAEQAENLAIHHSDLLAYVADTGGTMHIPVIFMVIGEARKADTFIKMLSRAIFIGENNKSYIHETINQLVESETGKPVRIIDTTANRYPLGYEPVWNPKRNIFQLASLYTFKSHGVSLKGTYQQEAKNHNKDIWDSFLSSINTSEQ